jgi:hypothetical protein
VDDRHACRKQPEQHDDVSWSAAAKAEDIPILGEYCVTRFAETIAKQIRNIDKHTVEQASDARGPATLVICEHCRAVGDPVQWRYASDRRGPVVK